MVAVVVAVADHKVVEVVDLDHKAVVAVHMVAVEVVEEVAAEHRKSMECSLVEAGRHHLAILRSRCPEVQPIQHKLVVVELERSIVVVAMQTTDRSVI
jgi:hypothetical protein